MIYILKQNDLNQNEIEEGLVVNHYLSGKVYNFGSPQVELFGICEKLGSYDIQEDIENNPSNYFYVLEVDLPINLPINEEIYHFNFKDAEHSVFHYVKKRGMEFFSTINSDTLPYFSSLRITGTGFSEDGLLTFEEKRELLSSGVAVYQESYYLILSFVSHVGKYMFSHNQKISLLSNSTPLSYTISYFSKSMPLAFKSPVVYSIYPYTGYIKVESAKPNPLFDNESFKKYLSHAMELEKYTNDVIKKTTFDKTFKDKVVLSLHDFMFYVRQHSKSIKDLSEESIRDLYLVILKNLFISAEGEAFHFDGKLDFKVSNLENRYEFITGEFKWWRSENSVKEVFHQAVRKHATSQEEEIYIIILSDKKDFIKIENKVVEIIMSESEIVPNTLTRLTIGGSKESIHDAKVKIRGNEINLKICIADLYYQNV